MGFKSDIEIAQETPMLHIREIAKTAGVDEKYLEQYGNYKAKLDLSEIRKQMTIQTIGHDKLNQLRHVRFLKDKAHTLEIMKLHASVMAPKFECVAKWLNREIRPLGIAHWNDPKGGYFVSLFAMPGTAKRALALCKEAGVTMTGAGATYPYGRDPQDSNIRIAPSLPPVEELKQAMEIFCLCIRIAALEKLDEA